MAFCQCASRFFPSNIGWCPSTLFCVPFTEVFDERPNHQDHIQATNSDGLLAIALLYRSYYLLHFLQVSLPCLYFTFCKAQTTYCVLQHCVNICNTIPEVSTDFTSTR